MQSKLIDFIEEMDVAYKKELERATEEANQIRSAAKAEATRIVNEAREDARSGQSASSAKVQTAEVALSPQVVKQLNYAAERQEEAVRAVLKALEV